MNILSFDIEEWFHILDNDSTKGISEWSNFESRIHANMDKIFNLLEDNNQSATFFCIGWIAKKYPDVIKRIDNLGYEIGTHSDMHQLAYNQNRKVYSNDLENSIKSLEDIIGKKIISYRAPGFSIKEENKWVFEELIKQGITIDCSIFPAKRSHGGFPSFGVAEPCWIDIGGMRLKEFPINVAKRYGYKFIFSGGGYFRLLPYKVIKNFCEQADYTMTYFHPRDFDAEQPMIQDLSLIRKFKSYYGLRSCYSKLDKLLHNMDFIDLRTADDEVDWRNATIKYL
jgi:peptidoglycan-N-acetylglucosamine deacetylase